MIVKTEAIVLNSFKYGESSKIVTLFTKDFGKIKVIAKGARKQKNKFGSALDPLSYCQISFYHKPTTELYLLSDAEHIIPLRKIQDLYHHLSAGLIIAEAVNVTQDVQELNAELFRLVTDVLISMNEKPKNPFSLSTFFLLKLSEIIGFAIDFAELDSYEKRNFKKQFSIESGSFVEKSKENNIFTFDFKIADELRLISVSSLSNVGEIVLEKSSLNQIHEFFNLYFSYHLDRKNTFRTMNFFKTIL